MSVRSGSHHGEDGYNTPHGSQPTSPQSVTTPVIHHLPEVHVPIETVNTNPRLNPNYQSEAYSLQAMSARTHHVSGLATTHFTGASSNISGLTTSYSQPIAHTSVTMPMSSHHELKYENHVQPLVNIPSAHVYYKSLNLASLNLKYSGETDIDEFLLRLNETRLARQIDDATLCRGISELLSGTALKFYRTVSHKLVTWNDICTEFRKFFQTKDYNFNIEKQIRERKQQPGQSVSFFILDIQDLNSRLDTPITERSLLEIVKHNMLSSYAQLLAINDITSFEQLVYVTKNYEAYSGVLAQAKSVPKREVSVISGAHKSFNNTLECLKCKRRGHSYKECRSVPGITCFKCGCKGTLTKDCRACKPTSSLSSSHNTKN